MEESPKHYINIGASNEKVTFESISIPKWIGGYDINGTDGGVGSCIIKRQSKPNMFHRLCCKFFLGWKWIDDK